MTLISKLKKEPSPPSVLSRLRRGIIEAFVLRTLGLCLLFLLHSVLSRLIGSEGYGIFSYAVASAGMLAVVVPLGWPTALMRFLVQYMEQQQWGLLRGVVLRAHQITLLTSISTALALWGITFWSRLPPDLSQSLHYAALLLPCLASVGVRRKAFQGLQRIKASILLEEILLPVLAVTGFFIFAVTTASHALRVYCGAAFVVALVGSVWLWCSLPIQGRNARPEFQTRLWMTVALPMVFGGISQFIMNRIDVLMLGAMVDMKAVGLYSVADRIATLNILVLGAVNTIAVPMLASAYHGQRVEQFKDIKYKAILCSTIAAIPLLVVMLCFPQTLLSFFGLEFSKGASLLRVLALGQFVNAATGPVGFALLMTERERHFALSMAIVAGGNVLGNLLVIPVMGALGAAIVSTVSVAVLNGWQFWLTRNTVIFSQIISDKKVR